jgi:hypothetical protein
MPSIDGTIVASADKYHRMFDTLIRASHRNYIDLETFLPWTETVVKRRPPKKLDQLWIYGTPYWDQLSDEQRLEVAWLETARDVSMFIHLEHFLPLLYGGYVNEHKDALDPRVYEYLMLFAREELTHIMAFRRYMKLAQLPVFGPPVSWSPFTKSLTGMRPEFGILSTLMIEWMAELAAMHGTQSDEIEPLTRKLFRTHHGEEVRHIAFAKAIGAGFIEQASAAERSEMRQFLRGLLDRLLPVFTYNPEIASHTSFTFPVSAHDIDAIAAVRNSEYNRALNELRFAELTNWCADHGIA